MDSDIIKKRIDRIPDLPTLPQVAVKVNELLENTDVSPRMLNETIIQDQAIVTNILKLVNSPFYGFPSKIDNLTRAIMVLGFDTLRNAILSVSTIETFSKVEGSNEFSIIDFWKHSIAVAVTSRQLSIRIPLEVPETCFVGGLLHDIGKVIMFCFLKEDFKRVMSLHQAEGMSLLEAEKSLFSMNHAMVGGYMAKRWRLPQNLINAIVHHHNPEKDEDCRGITTIVHAGNHIVNKIMNGQDTPSIVPSCHDERTAGAIKRLIEESQVWFEEIRSEIESACAFFQIQ